MRGHKHLVCNSGDCLQYSIPRFNPWVGRILWRRKWQSTPVFLPGKSCEQRSLAGYRVSHDLATKPPNQIFSQNTVKTIHTLVDKQQSPAFLAPGTSFVVLPWTGSGGDSCRMIQARCIYCVLHF